MLKAVRRLVKYTSSQKGAKVTLALWLALVVVLGIFAPGAKEYESNSSEGSINESTDSEIAQKLFDEKFPSDDGLTALFVFNRDTGLTESDHEVIEDFSLWLTENKPEHVSNSLPFHEFPREVQDQMYSENKTTLLFNVALEKDIDSSATHDVLNELTEEAEKIGLDGMILETTGPAGISSDTISLFKDADLVLILSTVALIFILLILIYRSPILAITPLIIAGIVYGVVDKVIGLVGKYELFVIEGQAVSIMLVLLFAVITDYSLFIFSRYREELSKEENKYTSMQEAIYHVAEPVFYSGGTVLLAMLALFATLFNPYNHFAPVFSIAIVFILIAGLTLIPALFALMGRRAFWPFIPKVNEENVKKHRFWGAVGNFVVKRPGLITVVLLLVLGLGIANVTTMKPSFNLLKSFPEDMSSRVGFELLEDNYPAGQLAPLNILLESEEEIDLNEETLTELNHIAKQISHFDGIDTVSPDFESKQLDGVISEDKSTIKMQLVLDGNPYETNALNTVDELRSKGESIISSTQLTHLTMHIQGQTADQLDVKNLNTRDMIVLFSIVIVTLTLVLGFQTKSIKLPVLMMGTIVLSYVATLGFGWFIFENFLGYDAISYRLPVYTFIFMVALGIDYNIMLVSRINELHASGLSFKESIRQAITLTGGVISSAGLILAATFAVLMTQPLQELFLFGFIMAIGILFDTFIIRGFLLPAILLLTHKE